MRITANVFLWLQTSCGLSCEWCFQSIDLSPASIHDIHCLKEIKERLYDCILLGDKGYLSSEAQVDLFNYANITLETPERINQKDYKPQFCLFKKHRKIIETLFSQLCDQFMITRNYAKTFEGFKTRVLAKIAALTIVQFIIKNYLNKKINNLKSSIF